MHINARSCSLLASKMGAPIKIEKSSIYPDALSFGFWYLDIQEKAVPNQGIHISNGCSAGLPTSRYVLIMPPWKNVLNAMFVRKYSTSCLEKSIVSLRIFYCIADCFMYFILSGNFFYSYIIF